MPRRKRKIKPPYRSLYEQDIADNITCKFTYEQYSYEYEQPIRRNRAYCGECGATKLMRTGWYTPDFFMANGIVIEAKGKFTANDRAKILAVRDTVAELQGRLVLMFMRDNKLNKRAKMRYSDWAEQHGFDYVVGTEPKKEWMK